MHNKTQYKMNQKDHSIDDKFSDLVDMVSKGLTRGDIQRVINSLHQKNVDKETGNVGRGYSHVHLRLKISKILKRKKRIPGWQEILLEFNSVTEDEHNKVERVAGIFRDKLN